MIQLLHSSGISPEGIDGKIVIGINDWLIQVGQNRSAGSFEKLLVVIDEICQDACLEMERQGCPPRYARALLLKIANLLIAKAQYQERHDQLISFPYALFIDPANGCPLHCPGCLHNSVFQQKIHPDWPNGFLSETVYSHFMRCYGPYATHAMFYNWGEPLLNRQTPQLIRVAKSYMLQTSLSSNLSLEFDAEDLVSSGLDYMVLSIDGLTDDTYNKYRRGGRLRFVLENVHRLVAAKKKLGMATPVLSWQFLLFEHNRHEVPAVKKLAREMGVNEIHFAMPYGVPWDASILPARDAKPEYVSIVDDPAAWHIEEIPFARRLAEDFDLLFDQTWRSRFHGGQPARQGVTCRWLYSVMALDARGRSFPCCYAPRKNTGLSYTFACTEEAEDRYNSLLYRYARRHFVEMSDLRRSDGEVFELPATINAPYCVACKERKDEPLIHSEHLRLYLLRWGRFAGLSEEGIRCLVDWDTNC